MKNIRSIGVDTINVSLAKAESGQYRIEYKNSETQKTRFICHCFGFENSIRVANGIALDQCEYVMHPGFKPEHDISQYP